MLRGAEALRRRRSVDGVLTAVTMGRGPTARNVRLRSAAFEHYVVLGIPNLPIVTGLDMPRALAVRML
jgi:hypothetical protein